MALKGKPRDMNRWREVLLDPNVNPAAIRAEQEKMIMQNHRAPYQLAATPASFSALDLREIQGDILIGLQKKWERFAFFSINDVPAFKRVLRSTIAPRITTTELVHQRELLLQAR